MAAASSSLDNMIAIKIQHDGISKRAKMPLRDMVPEALEKRVRSFLHVPSDAETVFERYSDSAGAYILLDPKNPSVYKQLYRAAKAKSKLKLRVSIQPQEASGPKPVSLEEVPDDSSPSNASPEASQPATSQEMPLVDTSVAPSLADPVPVPVPEVTPLTARASLSKAYEASDLANAARIAEQSDLRRELDSRIANFAADLARDEQMFLNQPSLVTRSPQQPPVCPTAQCTKFAICCNSCERTTPGVHYHCSTCEDGDFDLCQTCVDQGITCHGSDHWLIKRTNVDGQIVTSFTETIAPKPKTKPQEVTPQPDYRLLPPAAPLESAFEKLRLNTRTCNGCVQERPDVDFLHCRSCDDYDLCEPCFIADGHGHHPKHEFEPAVTGTEFSQFVKSKLRPGRNQVHQAICDSCDKFITGVRHKCLDCPDWDLCGSCISNATILHPKHRFVPVYESLAEANSCVYPTFQPVHPGICCDGPNCTAVTGQPTYIRGIRYKCAVCNDVDFCAGCEASPWNTHNKTHPLIKFKTPVRHVSVTTTGERSDGQRMPRMGDVPDIHPGVAPSSPATPKSKSAETPKKTEKPEVEKPAVTVKTEEVKEVKVVDTPKADTPKADIPKADIPKDVDHSTLRASFRSDTVADGTIFSPGQVFEQSWVLRNDSDVAWPAGCAVQYVGGDYMGHVDPKHPAGISELVSASKSTVCYAPLAPGQEFSFTVLLRTPPRCGKAISFWRLTTPDGHKFGDRIWCDVNVRDIKNDVRKTPEPTVESSPKQEVKEEPESQVSSSQMIFPKLEKESPAASTLNVSEPVVNKDTENTSADDDFEECGEDDEWDASDDGFLTDEEYDILDASDEEFLEEQQKKLTK